MSLPYSLGVVPSYAVNLDRRPDRWDRLARHAHEMGMPVPVRWPAVDGKATSKPAEIAAFTRGGPSSEQTRAADIGTAKSFAGLLRFLTMDPPDWALILEDDVMFHPDLHLQWRSFAPLVPADALIILLGCVHKNRPVPVDGTWRRCWRVTKAACSHAFMVRADAVLLLRSTVTPPRRSFDWGWNDVHSLGRTYCPSPHLAIQRPGELSDLSGRRATRSTAQYGPERGTCDWS